MALSLAHNVTRHLVLPPENPLKMPEQVFDGHRYPSITSVGSHIWRKLTVLGFGIITTLYLSFLMYRVLNVSGLTPLEWTLLGVFIVNVSWISFAFSSALSGFITTLFARRTKPSDADASDIVTKTAILFPIYNESVTDVFATVEATARALAKAAPGKFECFILSDTGSPEVALLEEAGMTTLKENVPAECPVYYRRRTINVARKSGNVHDFVSRWGGRYDHMIIYDADSYMETSTLIELVNQMQDDPDVGLIQTVPRLIGAETLFARAQQFAASIYGPVLGRGIAWWAQNEGNYWGHNAIIRVSAFADAAGLPQIPGRAPFGGHILSHDFVEAALLRRAGWKVRIAPELFGSYEEGPQNIIDLTIRDRRWCQGNLQHTAVLMRARGLSFTSRLHFSIGIMSYLASPLWLVLILVGMALSLQNRFLRPEYFSGDPALVPEWPVIDPALALGVFGATMAILLLPKLFGVITEIARPTSKKRLNPLRIIAGALLETVISALVAPVLMAAQTSSVLSILTGRDSGWKPQQRGGRGYSFGDVARRHMLTTVFGIALTATAWIISPIFAAWLAPATLGLVFAIPLSYVIGRSAEGDASKATLLSTAEDVSPPESYSTAISLRRNYSDPTPPSISEVLKSRFLQENRLRFIDPHWPLQGTNVHVPLATAEARIQRSQTVAQYLASLSNAEVMAVLNAPRVAAAVQRQFRDTGDQKN